MHTAFLDYGFHTAIDIILIYTLYNIPDQNNNSTRYFDCYVGILFIFHFVPSDEVSNWLLDSLIIY